MFCPTAGLSIDVSAPYLVVKLYWSFMVLLPIVNAVQLGPSNSDCGWLSHSQLPVSFLYLLYRLIGPHVPREIPFIGQNFLQARRMQSIRK